VATWVSASTDDYWYSYSSSYVGGGIWECGNGPNATTLYEDPSSPFFPDPYSYEEGVTHSGIRLNLTWNPSSSWNSGQAPVIVKVITNLSGYLFYSETLNFPVDVLTQRSYLIEFTPQPEERVIDISFGVDFGFFGAFYGSTPLISNIEVRVVTDEIPARWTSFVGSFEFNSE